MKYRELAARLGVSLASEENRSKAFGPRQVGEVLGLDYDTERWKNWIPQDKSDRLIRELCEIMDMKGARNEDWMKVAGKLNHYHLLVQNGKFNRALITHAVSQDRKKDVVIKLESTESNLSQAKPSCSSSLQKTKSLLWIMPN